MHTLGLVIFCLNILVAIVNMLATSSKKKRFTAWFCAACGWAAALFVELSK